MSNDTTGSTDSATPADDAATPTDTSTTDTAAAPAAADGAATSDEVNSNPGPFFA
ncbi:MAG: hypothetical protein JST25_13770 [Actinobacteria bacterium]|nr:hypothetical protein [Actinomycetota bacterium]